MKDRHTFQFQTSHTWAIGSAKTPHEWWMRPLLITLPPKYEICRLSYVRNIRNADCLLKRYRVLTLATWFQEVSSFSSKSFIFSSLSHLPFPLFLILTHPSHHPLPFLLLLFLPLLASSSIFLPLHYFLSSFSFFLLPPLLSELCPFSIQSQAQFINSKKVLIQKVGDGWNWSRFLFFS